MNTTLPRPLESAVQRECLRICDRMDIPCWRRNVGLLQSANQGHVYRAGKPGQADLYGFLPRWSRRPGVHWECELKRPGAIPTYEQVVWLRQCNEITEAAFWCDNTQTFAAVLHCLCEGMRISYPPFDYTPGIKYRVKVPGTRKTRLIVGPSYEYDLIKATGKDITACNM